MAQDHRMGCEVWYVAAHLRLAKLSLLSPGDVVGVTVMGQHIIYLNSFEAAGDLLEKRSVLYSDRSQSSMLEL